MRRNHQISDFTWESFQACINKDLSDVLGNFVSRVTKFSVSKFGNQVPSFINYSERQNLVIDEISEKLSLLSKNLENIEIRKACLELRNIWSIGNEYLQSAEPWKIYKEFPTEAGSIINFSFNLINLYSTISQPFIPETCSKIINDLKLPETGHWPANLGDFLLTVRGGHKFNLPDNLFQKISDQQREAFADKFSGL